MIVTLCFFFFFQAEDGIRDIGVTGVQTCALPISGASRARRPRAPCGGRRTWRPRPRARRGRPPASAGGPPRRRRGGFSGFGFPRRFWAPRAGGGGGAAPWRPGGVGRGGKRRSFWGALVAG